MLLFKCFLLFLSAILVGCEITCRNENTGKPVDWFTLYKLPRMTTIEEWSTVDNPFIEQGTAHTFMTNESIEWQLSSLSINDTLSFPGRTLSPLYDPNSNIGYILYNDQADKVTMIQGHTKGVILFDNESAIWLVHSIPHFPPKPSTGNYSIQPSQCVYGQSMLCMTLNVKQLEKIGLQLLFNYPQVYDSYIPAHLSHLSILSNLARVINGQHVNIMPWFNLNQIETVNGEVLMSFAKYTLFGDDLYSGIVAPNLSSNVLTETWNNGAGTLDSNCSTPYQVHNIEQIKFESLGLRFSVHRDHSKWAVTNSVGKRIACVGDINRQEEQFRRGGGTVCFLNNEKVWNQYNKLVDDVQPCKTSKSYRRNRINEKRRRAFIRKFKMSDSNESIVLL